MKKVFLLAAVAGLAMVSCKKDYTCECVTSSNDPSEPSMTVSGSTGKMKKKDAESKCNKGDESYSVPDFDDNNNPITYTYKVECSIK